MNRLFLLLIVIVVLAYPASARADGIIIPDPPICDPCPPPPPCQDIFPCPPPRPVSQLVVRSHRVEITVQDQVAVTRVDQVFFNPNDWQVEGTYLFPLPADAAVSNFKLWVDGKPVEGKILDAEQARQTYRQIVSSLQDPALLEYVGRGAVQASIFPIPPQGERRIALEYSQALSAENGLVRYVYPLSTEKFSMAPIESVSVSVDMRSSAPIRAVYSPSHEVDIIRDGENHAIASYEASNVLPDSDFALYYSTGESQAFHLLTYRNPGEEDPDGFFMLLLAPEPDVRNTPLPKDILLVLDRSGSMEGEKFQQAQEALRYILGHLNPGDRFNVITFSSGLESYAGDLRPASEASAAIDWVNQLSAQGSTDINRALLEAASMTDTSSERPAYLIFLTDGLPTVGVIESQQILDNFAKAAPQALRLFAFGVGYDVDTYLLDSLAQAHHGASSYVMPGDRLDEQLSAFYEKISTPVLTDLALDFGSLQVYDLYPSPLPDLFRGSQIVLVGRYREGGQADITLRGMVNGEPQSFNFPGQVFSVSSTPADAVSPLASIPRLWAVRKIGYLLSQVRLQGADQETIDQIVRLSIRFGVVTPYTSYLVTEDMPLGAAQQDRIAQEQFRQMQSAPEAPASGQAAVEKAVDQGALSQADVAAAPEASAESRVKIVGERTFVLSGEKWVDTAFDPERQQPVKVAFLSNDYFALAGAHPDLAAAFALGQQVIALSGGNAYEVMPSGEHVVPALQVTPAISTALPGETIPPTGNPPRPAVAPVLPAKSEVPAAGPCATGLLPLGLVVLGGVFAALKRRN